MGISVHAGDIALVGKTTGAEGLLDEAISFAESREALGDSSKVHATVITNDDGQIMDRGWHVQYGSLDDYIGRQILILRYLNVSQFRLRYALYWLDTQIGKRYPVSRLFLDLLGLGTKIFKSGWQDCSEEAVGFLYRLTTLKSFEHWAGWMPSDLADLEHWREFEVVYSGPLHADWREAQ